MKTEILKQVASLGLERTFLNLRLQIVKTYNDDVVPDQGEEKSVPHQYHDQDSHQTEISFGSVKICVTRSGLEKIIYANDILNSCLMLGYSVIP